MLTLGILAGVFVYLQIGYQLGRLSWRAWTDEKAPGALQWLLFPGHKSAGRIGTKDRNYYDDNLSIWISPDWFGENIQDVEVAKDLYRLGLAIFWPVKVAVNLATGSVLGALWLALSFIQGPEKLLQALAARRQAKQKMLAERAVGNATPAAISGRTADHN